MNHRGLLVGFRSELKTRGQLQMNPDNIISPIIRRVLVVRWLDMDDLMLEGPTSMRNPDGSIFRGTPLWCSSRTTSGAVGGHHLAVTCLEQSSWDEGLKGFVPQNIRPVAVNAPAIGAEVSYMWEFLGSVVSTTDPRAVGSTVFWTRCSEPVEADLSASEGPDDVGTLVHTLSPSKPPPKPLKGPSRVGFPLVG